MLKKNYTTLPSQYAVCIHSDCPMAATCLHLLAYDELVKTNEYLYIINPTKCVKDQSCKHYRSNKPEIYARGFTNFQNKMYPNQYDTFKYMLTCHFGHNRYFLYTISCCCTLIRVLAIDYWKTNKETKE